LSRNRSGATEADLFKKRTAIGSEEKRSTVPPLPRQRTDESAFRPLLVGRVWIDVCEPDHDIQALLNLVLRLYGLSKDPATRELWGSMSDASIRAGH
jgi:hypothetical protein